VSRHFTNPILLSERIENIIRNSEYLGKGNNGVVYRIDDHTIIKIFNDKKVCQKEYEVLKRSKKCDSFPKVYDFGRNYIIRDYIDGIRLDKYLTKNSFNLELARSIVNLIKDFKKMHYKKIDIRCKDLYVQEDFSIKVIDPKNNFDRNVSYPRHLMKGIHKRKRLEDFLFLVKEIDCELYEYWSTNIVSYLEKHIK
jgi:RIO-like serine/threonine protein kinase